MLSTQNVRRNNHNNTPLREYLREQQRCLVKMVPHKAQTKQRDDAEVGKKRFQLSVNLLFQFTLMLIHHEEPFFRGTMIRNSVLSWAVSNYKYNQAIPERFSVVKFQTSFVDDTTNKYTPCLTFSTRSWHRNLSNNTGFLMMSIHFLRSLIQEHVRLNPHCMSIPQNISKTCKNYAHNLKCWSRWAQECQNTYVITSQTLLPPMHFRSFPAQTRLELLFILLIRMAKPRTRCGNPINPDKTAFMAKDIGLDGPKGDERWL